MVLRVFHDDAGPLEMDEPMADRRVTRRRRAAVLFVDMVGSTACFRQMMPEQVFTLLRHLMALLRE